MASERPRNNESSERGSLLVRAMHVLSLGVLVWTVLSIGPWLPASLQVSVVWGLGLSAALWIAGIGLEILAVLVLSLVEVVREVRAESQAGAAPARASTAPDVGGSPPRPGGGAESRPLNNIEQILLRNEGRIDAIQQIRKQEEERWPILDLDRVRQVDPFSGDDPIRLDFEDLGELPSLLAASVQSQLHAPLDSEVDPRPGCGRAGQYRTLTRGPRYDIRKAPSP